MLKTIDIEVVLACVYAVFLLLSAFGLELLALLFLAGLLLVAEMIRHATPLELLILSGFLAPVAFVGSQLSSTFLAARR
jgi:hypothetical protein